MRETLTLLSHKAAEERHRDEEEKDDEKYCAADHTLRFGPESTESTTTKTSHTACCDTEVNMEANEVNIYGFISKLMCSGSQRFSSR